MHSCSVARRAMLLRCTFFTAPNKPSDFFQGNFCVFTRGYNLFPRWRKESGPISSRILLTFKVTPVLCELPGSLVNLTSLLCTSLLC